MWHAPNQRLRAIANAKKRERERARRPIHIRRIIAEMCTLGPEGETPKTMVRLVLNDISPKGVGIFSPDSLSSGQEVKLELTEPSPFLLKARVVWCQEYHANSHVLTDRPYSYRMGLEFIVTPEEEQTLKAFCDEISRKYLFTPRSP